MARIFYLMGKSAVGKDTVHRRLTELSGGSLATVVPYTTRPRREGEKEGRDYHFIDEATAEEFRQAGRIIEERCYHTVHGPWRYMTVDDGQIDPASDTDFLMIGTLESYRKMRARFGEECLVPLYLTVPDDERLLRAISRERKQREPKYAEICRRFLADEEDFSEENLAAAGITERYDNSDSGKLAADIWEMICRTRPVPAE